MATETRDDRIGRLAAKARAEGVRIIRHRGTQRYFATSGSRSNVVYTVTLDTCSCPAGIARGAGHCKHSAALLTALGRNDDGEPDTPAPGAVEDVDADALTAYRAEPAIVSRPRRCGWCLGSGLVAPEPGSGDLPTVCDCAAGQAVLERVKGRAA